MPAEHQISHATAAVSDHAHKRFVRLFYMCTCSRILVYCIIFQQFFESPMVKVMVNLLDKSVTRKLHLRADNAIGESFSFSFADSLQSQKTPSYND